MAKHELGDLAKIRQNLERWLAQRLPDADDLSLDELKFPEESGESSVTLLLSGRGTGGPVHCVCRMKPIDSHVFDSHDLELQYRLMQIAGEAGVPVPFLFGYESDTSLVGSDFYIMEFIDGQIPTDNPPFAFGGWVTELDDAQRALMWNNGLEAMARVHMIDLNDHDLPTLPRSEPGQSPIQHEIDKFDAMITEQLRKNMDPDLAEALAFIMDNAPTEGPRRLCWGDSRVGNVIWRDLAPVALIDWEMANQGDPLQDVSWWYWIDYINSVGLGVERLGGLPELADIYQSWSDITGLPTANSDYYDLFSVVRYAIILDRKFDALEAAGLGRIDNFVLPFVSQQLAVCKAG
jgi:aminoglycoside phosphotransferase (APT) family kinase protein